MSKPIIHLHRQQTAMAIAFQGQTRLKVLGWEILVCGKILKPSKNLVGVTPVSQLSH